MIFTWLIFKLYCLSTKHNLASISLHAFDVNYFPEFWISVWSGTQCLILSLELFWWNMECLMWIVDWWKRSCGLNFMQERRSDKEKCWRKERVKNSFRNAFPKLGRLAVGQVSASRQVTNRRPNQLGSISRMLHFPDLEVSVSRHVTDPLRFQFQKLFFLFLMSRLSLDQHAANRLDHGWLTDSQPTGDRTSNLTYF